MLNRWQGNTGKVQRIKEEGFEAKEPPRRVPPVQNAPNPLESLVKRIVPGTGEPLDNEDMILLLILYLMYRESGDSELLIIMGAIFLL